MQSSNIGDGIFQTLQQMRAQGMNDSSIPLFFAAHSPTPGSILQDYLIGNKTLAQKTSGLILLGSFLKCSYHLPSFPIPANYKGLNLMECVESPESWKSMCIVL